MTNPGLTKKGLTITMKLKLLDNNNDTQPHFIFDSGGHQGNGVSMFLINDELFCVVATDDYTWKVMFLYRNGPDQID